MGTWAIGGVGFTVDGFEEEDLSEEHRRFVAPVDRALLRVRVAPGPGERSESRDPRRIEGGEGWVRTVDAHARWRRTGAAAFEADATLAPPHGLSHLTTALTASLVEAEGGLVLHAAAVIVDGRAALLIGPSGAGKTSAANLCEGCRWLARDRVAVLDDRAWAMPGGDEIALPQAPNVPTPVGAILRVRRADQPAEVRRLDPVRALFALRESTQAIGDGASLDAPLALAERLGVHELRGRLEGSLTDLLRAATTP